MAYSTIIRAESPYYANLFNVHIYVMLVTENKGKFRDVT
jgi:hypothetical protein